MINMIVEYKTVLHGIVNIVITV